MTGLNIPRNMEQNSSVCQDCFMSLEKYDELQKQSKEIEVKLKNIFHNSRAESVFIKEELTEVNGAEAMEEIYFDDEQSFNDESLFNEDSETEEKPTIEKSLICDHCGAKFTSENSFLNHVKVHIPEDENRRCDSCSKVFQTTARLQFHLVTDHDRLEGPFDCPICFKKCQDRYSFQAHYYKHLQVKRFLCPR